MLKFLFTALLVIFAARLLGSVVGLFGRGRQRRSAVDGSRTKDAVEQPDYKDLTPYDIEDAEYEDLPKRD